MILRSDISFGVWVFLIALSLLLVIVVSNLLHTSASAVSSYGLDSNVNALYRSAIIRYVSNTNRVLLHCLIVPNLEAVAFLRVFMASRDLAKLFVAFSPSLVIVSIGKLPLSSSLSFLS